MFSNQSRTRSIMNLSHRLYVAILVVLCGTMVLAAPKKNLLKKKPNPSPEAATESNRSLASKQIATTRVESLSSSDAQMSGPIHLEDPRPQIIERQWSYLLQLDLVEALPQGKIKTDAGIVYDLDSKGRYLIPVLQLGFARPLILGSSVANPMWWSLSGGVGFYSKSAEVSLPSGFVVSDAGMSLMMTRMMGSIGVLVSTNWDVVLGAERGQYQINQVSSNDLAQFSRKVQYWGWGLGADYRLPSGSKLSGKYAFRNELTDTQILPNGNLEIGMKFIW